MRATSRWTLLRAVCALAALSTGVLGEDILETIGFSSCQNGTATINVQKVDIQYNNENKTVLFDLAGTSSQEQNVTAELKVTAFGSEIFSNSFNPCDSGTFVAQLCPVPRGTFSARGTQQIPDELSRLVPSIAFQLPDIAALATLELKSLDTGEDVACIRSQVSNGKTTNVPAVPYVAASIAGAALLVTGASAVGAALSGGAGAMGGGMSGSGAAGTGTPSPSFTEVFSWFQGLAMNGMLSVNYPPVYRSFAKNFAFSTGLIPWAALQTSIDDFRGRTGGNLTASSVARLMNTTLVFPDGTTAPGNGSSSKAKRALETFAILARRQIETSFDTTSPLAAEDTGTATGADDMGAIKEAVTGIQAYVQQLSIPESNTFMTVLLVVSIVIAAIAVGILLVKVVLEFWALFGNFPESLAGFRKHYWGSIARAITTLILLLYGVWVLYCVVQFTKGDSWAAKTLAGVTLAVFTGVLFFFSWKIWSTARKLKEAEGDASGLYEDKRIWVKYSLFYDSYKKSYWWVFVPTIVYMLVKGVVLAITDGSGRLQTASMIIIEGIMLILLLWSRPYVRKSGNIINIVIQVVRVLSVVCILVFVEEMGIAQTTQTVTGVVLIAVQSTLTGVLAILIVWNAFNACCKENPHRKKRKEMEKMSRDIDTLTPLDARNSLLLDREKSSAGGSTTFSMASAVPPEKQGLNRGPMDSSDRYVGYAVSSYGDDSKLSPYRAAGSGQYRPITPVTPMGDQDRVGLVAAAAPIGIDDDRQPTVPNVGPYPSVGGGYAEPYGGRYAGGYGGNGNGRSYY
ncbi:related to calcium-related spray protein [Cephalotrichum gorgonifer]|uniref:Related to calcium-related spray protein n=1 Tax=Cephalotrichum gorgonifer TaxID=2041049 RepID=A0AAE8SRD7_9PEZI|nr:related to calcium-related spray protein [Cephalotrichum gorgonifer]